MTSLPNIRQRDESGNEQGKPHNSANANSTSSSTTNTITTLEQLYAEIQREALVIIEPWLKRDEVNMTTSDFVDAVGSKIQIRRCNMHTLFKDEYDSVKHLPLRQKFDPQMCFGAALHWTFQGAREHGLPCRVKFQDDLCLTIIAPIFPNLDDNIMNEFPFNDVHFKVTVCQSRLVEVGTVLDLARKLKEVSRERNVFISETSRRQVEKRQIYEPLSTIRLVQSKATAIAKAWNDNLNNSTNQVLILSGSSGSGKTVQSILCSKMVRTGRDTSNSNSYSNSTITFYFTSADLRTANWSGETYDDPKFHHADETNRDACVRATVLEAIDDLLNEYRGELKIDRRLTSTDNDCKIVLIFDELGPLPVFLRGLCSTAATLAKEVEQKFFDFSSEVNRNISRVHFIAVGTGVIAPEGAPPASGSSAFNLDDDPISFASMIDLYFFSKLSASKLLAKEKLLRLSSCPQHHQVTRSTSSEIIMSSLVKNARCAAICCTLFREEVTDCDPEEEIFARCCDKVLDDILTGLIPKVVRKYCFLNALSKFEYAENLLLTALAADAFHLPCLPQQMDGELRKYLLPRLRYQTNSTDARTAYEILSVTGGILTDTGPTLPKTSFSSRYRFPEPQCGMLYVLRGISPPSRSDTCCYGFEKSIAECCLLLAAASPFYSLLLKSGSVAAGEENYNVDDPLLPLKLCFKFPAAVPNERDGKLRVRYFRLNGEELFTNTMMMNQLRYFLVGHGDDMLFERGSAIAVMLFQDPTFADVVVVGPNKVILIQCTTRRTNADSDDDDVRVDKEIVKMGLLKEEPTHKKTAKKAKPGEHQEEKKPLPHSTAAQKQLLAELIKMSRVNDDDVVDIEVFMLVAVNQQAATVFIPGLTSLDGKFELQVPDRRCQCRVRQIIFRMDVEHQMKRAFFPALPNKRIA